MLITCNECKREISDKAASCPGCGAPVESAEKEVAAGVKCLSCKESFESWAENEEGVEICPGCGIWVEIAEEHYGQGTQRGPQGTLAPSGEGGGGESMSKVLLKWGCLIPLAIVLIIGVVVWFISSQDSGPVEMTSIRASIHAENAVRDRLVAPATASFSPYRDTTVTTVGDRWTVRGWVDSQNRFGAMVRTNYTVVIQVTRPGYFSIISVDLE